MTTIKPARTPGPKLTADGRYEIHGKHNCGCRILIPLGASYSIIGYCLEHVAAPELLTALKKSQEWLDIVGDRKILAQVRAAIAKAEGK